MRTYKPDTPFTVPVMLLIPQIVTAKGSTKKVYPETGDIFYCTFKTFGGTEIKSNDILVIQNTAVLQTWYRPDIKADCRIQTQNGDLYEVIGQPENIDQRNQYLVFKVQMVKGGA